MDERGSSAGLWNARGGGGAIHVWDGTHWVPGALVEACVDEDRDLQDEEGPT